MPPICSVHSWFLGGVILHYFEKDNLLIAVVVYMAFYLPLFHEVMKIISPLSKTTIDRRKCIEKGISDEVNLFEHSAFASPCGVYTSG